MGTLKSKPGITGASVNSTVPTDWSKSWFQNFVNNQLKLADVRNAVGSNGIVVGGNTTGYGTIALGAPFTVTSNSVAIAGSLSATTVAATASGSSLQGQVTVAAPSSAVSALVVDAYSSGAAAIDLSASSGQSSYQRLLIGGAVEGYIGLAGQTGGLSNDASVGDLVIRAAYGAVRLSVNNGASSSVVVATTGAVSIAAPSSGSALSITGVSGAYAEGILGGSTAGASYGLQVNAGTNASDAALSIANRAQTAQFMAIYGDGHGSLGPSATSGISWSATGAVSIAAPSSGSALTAAGNVIAGYGIAGTYASPQLNLFSTQYGMGVDASGNVFFKNTNNGAFNFYNNAGSPMLQLNGGNLIVQAPSSGSTLTVNGASGAYAQKVLADDVVNNAYGLYVAGGTSTSDAGFAVVNAAQTLNYFVVYGDGGVVVGSPTGADKGLGSINAQLIYQQGAQVASQSSGSFTVTWVGLTSNPGGTCFWTQVGNQVTLNIPSSTGTGSGTSYYFTGMPAAIIPARNSGQTLGGYGVNGGAVAIVGMYVDTSGNVNFTVAGSPTWTSGGSRSTGEIYEFTYALT